MFEKVKCCLCIAMLSRKGNPTALDIRNQFSTEHQTTSLREQHFIGMKSGLEQGLAAFPW